ncbi:MAG: carbohydrate-binding protein [Bacteroidota bacterium]
MAISTMKKLMTGVCLMLITPAILSQDAGFFLDDWQEKTAEIPAYEVAAKPGGDPTVTIGIDVDKQINKVPKYIYGNNAVTWDGGLWKNTTAMKDLNNLNPHVLRWPGGNLSNNYFWNLSANEKPDDIPANIEPWYGQNTPNWQTSTDQYYNLLENTNTTGIICVNYSYARYGTGPNPVAKAAHMAAEWVRYDNGRSKFWEIGNENFGSWQAGYEIDVSKNQDGQPRFISGELYGQHCRVFIDSMRNAADEIGVDIKIGVVAFDAETSYDDIQTVWNEGMMPEVGHLADFLVVHSYFTPYNEDSPVSTVLNSHTVPEHIMQTMVDDMAEAGKPMLPVAMTEWNIFAVGSMQQVSYVNGMLAAITLGEYVQNDYGLATRWDLVNGWGSEAQGTAGDDHGMFSVGGEPGVDPYNPRAVFFYMYYHQKFFGDRMVESSVSGNNSVIAHASTFSSGETGLVIINKSRTDETVLIEPENFNPGINYYYYTLTGGDDNGDFSRKVLINGIETDEQGGGPDNYESIEAHSSPTEGGIQVSLPGLSVVYVMIDKEPPPFYIYSKIDTNDQVITVELSNEVMMAENPGGFEVTKNGSAAVTVTDIEVNTVDSGIVNLWLGESILAEDEITVAYSGEDIMGRDSALLTAFADTLVDNLLPGSAPRLLDVYTNPAGTMVEMVFNKKMEAPASATDLFVLEVDGDPVQIIDISSITIPEEDSTIIRLTPAEPLYTEYNLQLSYSGTDLTSVDNGILEAFENRAITNQAPGMPPEIISAETRDYGFTVVVFFNKIMSDLAGADFTIQVEEEAAAIASITSAQDSLVITLEENTSFGETVTLSYSGTVAQSTDRGELQEVTNLAVENTLPEPTIFAIPGTVDAEQFTINRGMELEATSDDGGGFNLGYIDPGDWLEFEIEVADTGYYSGLVRVAAASNTGQLLIQTPDGEKLNQDTIDVPVTGDWQTWESVSTEIILNKGRQRLRLKALTANFNLNWVSFEYNRTLEASVLDAWTNMVGDTVHILFDREMAYPANGNASAFTITADGTPINVTDTQLNMANDSALLLLLDTPISVDYQQIVVSYTPGNVTASDGIPVPAFADVVVANHVVTAVIPVGLTDMDIYPNPAKDHLVINSAGHGLHSVEIIDLTGKIVFIKDIGSQNEPIRLNLNLHPGIYMLKLNANHQGSSIKKIIIH